MTESLMTETSSIQGPSPRYDRVVSANDTAPSGNISNSKDEILVAGLADRFWDWLERRKNPPGSRLIISEGGESWQERQAREAKEKELKAKWEAEERARKEYERQLQIRPLDFEPTANSSLLAPISRFTFSGTGELVYSNYESILHQESSIRWQINSLDINEKYGDLSKLKYPAAFLACAGTGAYLLHRCEHGYDGKTSTLDVLGLITGVGLISYALIGIGIPRSIDSISNIDGYIKNKSLPKRAENVNTTIIDTYNLRVAEYNDKVVVLKKKAEEERIRAEEERRKAEAARKADFDSRKPIFDRLDGFLKRNYRLDARYIAIEKTAINVIGRTDFYYIRHKYDFPERINDLDREINTLKSEWSRYSKAEFSSYADNISKALRKMELSYQNFEDACQNAIDNERLRQRRIQQLKDDGRRRISDVLQGYGSDPCNCKSGAESRLEGELLSGIDNNDLSAFRKGLREEQANIDRLDSQRNNNKAAITRAESLLAAKKNKMFTIKGFYDQNSVKKDLDELKDKGKCVDIKDKVADIEGGIRGAVVLKAYDDYLDTVIGPNDGMPWYEELGLVIGLFFGYIGQDDKGNVSTEVKHNVGSNNPYYTINGARYNEKTERFEPKSTSKRYHHSELYRSTIGALFDDNN